MKRTLWPLLLVVGLAGCRLTDPIHAFQPLKAWPPEEPGWSVVFGHVRVAKTLFDVPVHTVRLRRIGPGDTIYYTVTDKQPYRAFLPRTVRDGYFMFTVPPGIYELEAFWLGAWWQRDVYVYTKRTDEPDHRLVVTRPGIYDLGDLMVHQHWAEFIVRPDSEPPDPERRAEVLRTAVTDTPWEKYLSLD